MRVRIFLMMCFLCSLSVLIGTSCNLDIPPEDEIAGDDAIDNVLTAREALHSAYAAYPLENVTFAVLAEDFFPTYLISRDASLARLYRWDAEKIDLVSRDLWAGYYKTIVCINVLLNSEKYIEQTTASDRQEWRKIKGEAYALKAMAYFDLLNIYAGGYHPDNPGIILKDEVELDYLPRSTAGECVKEIHTLLSRAGELLSLFASEEINYNKRESNYLNYYSVLLLQAKTALYEKDYTTATGYCETILSQIGYGNTSISLSDYQNLWTDSKSLEKLFSFDTNSFILNQFIESKENGDFIAVPSSFLYSENDIRRNVASFEFRMNANGSLEPVPRLLMGKYRTGIEDRTPRDINRLRLPEAYFILSECYAETGQMAKAVSTLDAFLVQRNAELLTQDMDAASFKNRLFHEKQKEFHGEGLNYFEMKRLGKSLKRYSVDSETVREVIPPTDYRWLFPIPQAELQNNGSVSQNRGWNDIQK